MNQPADWHLLFGLLALQNGLISREHLVAGFAKWTSDKSKSIDQWLVDDGALTPAHREMLRQLVGLHVQQHGDDIAQSLASLDGSNLPLAKVELGRLADSDLGRSIAHLPEAAFAQFATVAPNPDDNQFARFRILRPLEGGKGGMGEISVAEDQEIGRTVALKQIRSDFADSAAHRQKFQVEAEITGNLEHPGIVPIYSLGKDSSGRPFYAMRLVGGDNLHRAIEDFHHRSATRRPDDSSVEFRNLIDRLIDVAQAISYAHSRGVLHRDLKPGNILVGNFGETLVIDWGLARLPQDSQPATTSEPPTERRLDDAEPLKIRSDSELARTVQGSTMGTLGFAPPEQLQGNLAHVGPASDVYSLGAILYQILTGTTPIALSGRNAQEIMKDTVLGNIAPPRTHDAGISRPLAAICMKALAREPAQRYATAEFLIEELQRWKADQPVLACAETFAERAGRVLRRHRAASLATAVSIFCLALILTAALLVVNRQRRKEQFARETAERHRLIADWRLYAMQITRVKDRWDHGDYVDAIATIEKTAPEHRGWEYAFFKKKISDLLTWEQRVRRGHKVAYNHDGSWLATGSLEGEVTVWNAATHRELFTRVLDGGPIASVAFSPDGTTLLSAAYDTGPQLLDAQTGETKSIFKGDPAKKIHSARFSGDGRLVVTAGEDMTVRIWDARNGELIRTLEGHEGAVKAAVFNPSGETVASGAADKTVRLWDVETGQQVSLLQGHRNDISSLDYARDGKFLASASEDDTIKIWDSVTRECVQTLENPSSRVQCVAFTPDGSRLAAAGVDCSILIFNLDDKKIVKVIGAHKKFLQQFCVHPNGEKIASIGGDQRLREWNLQTSDDQWHIKTKRDAILCVDVHPHNHTFATGYQDGTVRIWNADTGELERSLEGKQSAINSVLWSARANQVVAACEDGHIVGWDALSGARAFELSGHQDSVRDIALIPGTDQIVSCSHDQSIRIWDLTTCGLTRAITGIGVPIDCVAVQTDQHRIISGSADGKIRVHDARTGLLQLEFLAHSTAVNCVAISPDGRRIASGSSIPDIRIWNAQTGQKELGLGGHERSAVTVKFTPDGKQLLSGNEGRIVRFWNLQSGEATFSRSVRSMISEVAISNDGAFITCAGRGTAIGIWHAAAPP